MSELTVEGIVDAVSPMMSEKADKAEVEAVKAAVESIEVPSIEGFAKSEEVASLVEKLEAEKAAREELQAKFDAAPAVHIKKEEDSMNGFKWDREDFNAKAEIDLSKEITKAYNVTTQVAGEPTSTARLYFELAQVNPYRQYATVMPMNSSTMELPTVTGITAAHEAAIPGSIDTTSGHAGSVSGVQQLVTQNFTSRSIFSDQSVEDLPGLDSMVAGFMAQQIGVAEAVDMVAQIKAGVNVSNGIDRVTTTGAALTVANLLDVKSTLSSAYKPNAKWFVSREVLADIRQLQQAGTGSQLIWDLADGSQTLLGYELIVNDHLEDFGTANNLLMTFGDHAKGCIIGNRKTMNISRHEDTIPGGVYYYGNLRSRGRDWDRDALVALRAGA